MIKRDCDCNKCKERNEEDFWRTISPLLWDEEFQQMVEHHLMMVGQSMVNRIKEYTS